MKKIFLIAALAAFPVASVAQEAEVQRMIEFDADGDGVVEKIGILATGCDGDECPVELFTSTGSVTLGYGSVVETGYVSPEELGLNDVSGYPENVPVVQIDGVLMAFNGEVAYPVSDLISKDALTQQPVSDEDVEWLSVKLNTKIDPAGVMKATGDLSPNGGDTVYSVYTGTLGPTSAWFIREASGAETARGFSMDYPRIYVNGKDLRVVSVSQSGFGIMDIIYPEGE